MLLAYYNGFSREQLAKQFDKPVNSIKTWLRRSLIEIRACLGSMTMDDDHIVLAAEWVLGTLRGRTNIARRKALIANEPGVCGALVRDWGRRLGELNALVAPVEPARPALLEKILARLPGGGAGQPHSFAGYGARRGRSSENLAATLGVEHIAAATGKTCRDTRDRRPGPRRGGASRSTRAISLHLNPPCPALAGSRRGAHEPSLPRWPLVFVTSLVRPDLLPRPLQPQPKVVEVVKTVEVPASEPARFTAVLQRDAASPAFILTVDLADRTMTVRARRRGRPCRQELRIMAGLEQVSSAAFARGCASLVILPRPSQLASFDADTIRRCGVRHLA